MILHSRLKRSGRGAEGDHCQARIVVHLRPGRVELGNDHQKEADDSKVLLEFTLASALAASALDLRAAHLAHEEEVKGQLAEAMELYETEGMKAMAQEGALATLQAANGSRD